MKILNLFSKKYLEWPEYKDLITKREYLNFISTTTNPIKNTAKTRPTTIIDLSHETIAKLLSQLLIKLPIKRGD